MNEVLPEFFAPITKMLRLCQQQHLVLRVNNLLVWSRILPSAYPPRAIDSAGGALGIAVTRTMGHAFRPGIWVDSIVLQIGRHWRDWRCTLHAVDSPCRHDWSRCVVFTPKGLDGLLRSDSG